jgi:molybdate transport system substrate-binding protein
LTTLRAMLPMSRRVLALFVGAASVVAVSASAHATTEPVASAEGDIVVFAAASLTDAFTAIGDAFESEHPDVDVTFNFAASSDLVTQIEEGAPADVFASADQRNMDKLVEAERAAADPATFASNSLAIIVEAGNPHGIASVDDLADPDLIVVTCDPEVPIGRYTEQVFEAAGIEVTPDSFEENVRGIVTKVVEGEADAGLVYVTDVLAAGESAEGVDIPADVNVVAAYPIAPVTDGPNPDGGAAFTEFVLSDDGQTILAEFGFGPIDAATPDTTTPETTPDTTTPDTTAA